MKRLFTASILLFLSYTGFSDLSVEWVNNNTVVVSGYGDGNYPAVVITNVVGVCTNCTAISPSELADNILDLSRLANEIYSLAFACNLQSDELIIHVTGALDDISTFQRFSDLPYATGGFNFADFSNYVHSVDNSQSDLVLSHWPRTLNSAFQRYIVSYNNGIYDYANQYVSPLLNDQLSQLEYIRHDSSDIMDKADSISFQLFSLSDQVEPCTNVTDYVGVGSGGSGGSGGTTNVFHCGWTEEQARAVLDYLRHIDDDQHKRHIQLAAISNSLSNVDKQLDSYASLVSGVLYNDGTIVVDDVDNSWTNVYRRGYSDLYEYDKSNILQRIELLLFGIAGVSSTTNWDEVGDIESSVVNAESNIASAGDSLSAVGDTVSDQLEGVSDHFNAMFEALNFFGSGTLLDFALNDPTTVFGSYDFEVTSNGADGLGDFRNLCRTCFQVIYWVGGIAFLLFFWYKVLSFVVFHVFNVIRFFNNLLT